MGFFLVMKAELTRTFIIMRRYWFATLTGLAIGWGMMMVLIVGFMSGGGEAVGKMVQGQNATNGALGLLIGMFGFGIVGMFTQGLQGMARTGELEQVCMSPHGLVTNFLARSFVSALSSILMSSILLMLVATSMKGNLHADPLALAALLFLTYLNLIGFGFMVGGLVLVLKQAGQVAMILRLILMGLAFMATEQISQWPTLVRWLAHILPITDAAICLKYTLIHGQQRPILDAAGEKIVNEMVPVLDKEGAPLLNEVGEQVMQAIYQTEFSSVFTHPSFFFLLVNCVVWTSIGIALFHYMESWSRHKGTLGVY
ncbi:MAG: ABC transporter permease [bacterium]|nr:ABC transporter permease [bacterium]